MTSTVTHTLFLVRRWIRESTRLTCPRCRSATRAVAASTITTTTTTTTTTTIPCRPHIVAFGHDPAGPEQTATTTATTAAAASCCYPQSILGRNPTATTPMARPGGVHAALARRKGRGRQAEARGRKDQAGDVAPRAATYRAVHAA
jgi:hypothetical protein